MAHERTGVTLIVGADGLVGDALMAYFQRAGKPVVGTTRRAQGVDDHHVFLDLAEDAEAWRCPWPVAVAIVCAGATGLEACKRDPIGTARVNVLAVAALARTLAARGAFVIYLSTNQVFDGSRPDRLPDDPVCPITEYGRQKAEAERRIQEWGGDVAIMRFTKILGPRLPLFAEWGHALRQGRPIHPFSDLRVAPVPLAFAVSVLHLAVDRRVSGVFQVSGNRDMSYAEAARVGARYIGAPEGLVQPRFVSRSGQYTEPIPAYTTLNTDRLRATFGVEPPDVLWTVETCFATSCAL